MIEASVCQATIYGGGARWAAARVAELLGPLGELGNPSGLAWAYYVLGEATAESDPERALAAYAAVLEHGTDVDNRLFVMLARSSALTLLAGGVSDPTALAEFGTVLDQWEDLGNELSQWWVLENLAVLLARLGEGRHAALLAGAVVANRHRYPAFVRNTRLEDAIGDLRGRLGSAVVDAAVDEGAAPPFAAAVALARTAIRGGSDRRADRAPRRISTLASRLLSVRPRPSGPGPACRSPPATTAPEGVRRAPVGTTRGEVVVDGIWAFVAMAVMLSVSPGPDDVLVLRSSLRGGPMLGLATVAGVGAGSLAWGVAAALGLAAVVARSAPVHEALRLVGAGYLVLLGVAPLVTGVRRARRRVAPPELDGDRRVRLPGGARGAFSTGLMSDLLNPKIGLFYLAVVPQFVPAGRRRCRTRCCCAPSTSSSR